MWLGLYQCERETECIIMEGPYNNNYCRGCPHYPLDNTEEDNKREFNSLDLESRSEGGNKDV